MIQLNLKTNNQAEEQIKTYLEQNVSEQLADKINNGIMIEKNNKTLINKKDLTGFMKFANDEARKLAEKGVRFACIEDKAVFGWAIHYFEEDSIEGTLYNEDGTEYKPAPKPQQRPKVEVKEKPKTKTNNQASFFDLFDTENVDKVNNSLNNTEQEKTFQQTVQTSYGEVDTNTGEIVDNQKSQTYDKETMKYLYTLLDGELKIE